MRNKAERRHNNWHKAIRKQYIYKHSIGYNTDNEDLYNNLHQYSKNDIHCRHCSDAHVGNKTNNRGRQKYYGQGSKLWKPSDLRKVIGLEEQLWNAHLN